MCLIDAEKFEVFNATCPITKRKGFGAENTAQSAAQGW